MLDVSLFLFYLREFHVGLKLQATALKKNQRWKGRPCPIFFPFHTKAKLFISPSMKEDHLNLNEPGRLAEGNFLFMLLITVR